MTAPARFRQADAKRMIRAAQDVGVKLSLIEVAPDGTLRFHVADNTTVKSGNSWSDV